MIAWIVLALILGLLVWLLVAPLILKIDTTTDQYVLRWSGIASAKLVPLPDDLLIRLRLFFWNKDVYPLHAGNGSKTSATPKSKKKGVRRPSMRLFRRLLRSFQVKTFQLSLDTDDYLCNGYLYPVFYFLSKGRRQLRINYTGQSELRLHVVNRPYRILLAFLTY